MSNNSAWVIGNGGHAGVVAEAWIEAGGTVTGFIDKAASGPARMGRPVISEMQFFDTRDLCIVIVGVGCVRSAPWRMDLLARYRAAGHEVWNVVHPRAYVSGSALLASGSVVLAGAIVACGVTVGVGAIVNHQAVVDHNVIIEDGVHVASGATICGNAILEEACLVGAGATVSPSVRVGAAGIVGAGAVATRDVAPGMVVVGVPARELPRV